jgi:quercetin dioxygenase-like cupin family protein
MHRRDPNIRIRLVVLLLSLVMLLGLMPSPLVAQGQPTVTEALESHYDAPQPLPAGPLDQVVQIVDVAPGAATPFHFHIGPGFAVITSGTLTHRRFALDRDSTYPTGASFTELADDEHYARNEGAEPVRILATFLIPRGGEASTATEEQPNPAPPGPMVPVAARVPIAVAAPGYAVTQLVRNYEPGAEMTSALAPGDQAVVLVLDGDLSIRAGKGTRAVSAGESWTESAGAATTSWNRTQASASVAVSIVSPQQR